MAAPHGSSPGDGRQRTSSPRQRGRENSKSITCRNVLIYGYCRNEKEGCAFNHDVVKPRQPTSHPESFKKHLNVDSPSFTPAGSDAGSSSASTKHAKISPKLAMAAPFTPRSSKASMSSGVSTPPSITQHRSSEWSSHGIPEFVPQSLQQQDQMGEVGNSIHTPDPFNPYDGSSAYSDLDPISNNAQINPYAQDSNAATSSGAAYFQQQNSFTPLLNHHLYAPIAPHRENLLAYQRTAHDLFISETLRQDYQRKAEATLQVLPNSSLPPSIEHFHTLVPLDTNNQKNTTAFGYNTWVFKATSSKDGFHYVLRRLEGFRLTSEKAVRSIKDWKRFVNGNIVTIHDCFTTRAFGDSSLVFVTDYHPTSKTLAEQHFPSLFSYSQHPRARQSNTFVPEQLIWNYVVQLTLALRTIHANDLAARLINPSKILITDKNRIRLNSHAILDVVNSNDPTPLPQLHLEDMRQLGRLTLALAASNPNASTNAAKALESLSRTYSDRLRLTIAALLNAGNTTDPNATHDMSAFSTTISDLILSTFDSSLHASDALSSNLARELENGRLTRLLCKLNAINERPEYTPQPPGYVTNPYQGEAAAAGVQHTAWSETGERYYLKLFRDHVFHQVDAEGRPVLDLGHMLTCLNKLDAGSEERVCLVSRDEQNVLVVSFREVKRGLEGAWGELLKAGRGAGRL